MSVRPKVDKAPKCYTSTELAELTEIHCKLVETEVFNYTQGGALWQVTQGKVADEPFAPVLRMVEDTFRKSPALSASDARDLLTRIGAHLAIAIRDNETDYFRRLAVVLDARKQGVKLSELTNKNLFRKIGRGRSKTPLDLSRVFPLVLIEATGSRARMLNGEAFFGEFTITKISRQELKKAVKDRGATISDSELSRWIKQFNFGQFMAEQPIARKGQKIC